MKRKKKKDHRKAIGAQVSIAIWDELKVQAIREGRTTGQVLDDAIQLYLEKNKIDYLKWGLRLPDV